MVAGMGTALDESLVLRGQGLIEVSRAFMLEVHTPNSNNMGKQRPGRKSLVFALVS
jgi:hypothetical protein